MPSNAEWQQYAKNTKPASGRGMVSGLAGLMSHPQPAQSGGGMGSGMAFSPPDATADMPVMSSPGNPGSWGGGVTSMPGNPGTWGGGVISMPGNMGSAPYDPGPVSFPGSTGSAGSSMPGNPGTWNGGGGSMPSNPGTVSFPMPTPSNTGTMGSAPMPASGLQSLMRKPNRRQNRTA